MVGQAEKIGMLDQGRQLRRIAFAECELQCRQLALAVSQQMQEHQWF